MERKKSAKDYLAASAIELLSKGRVENITVRQIADNCGISTRTFYNHFKDKNDLFLYIYTRELEKFFREHKDGLTFEPFMYHTGQILWEYQEFFKNFQAYTGQNNFRESVYDPLMEYYERIITECFHDEVTKDLHESLMFFVHGMIGYVYWYYSQPQLQPLDEGIPVFIRSCPEILKKYI